ncbi:MAG TPA: AAA family ATPase [Planctomycetota bacterium]|nr:AAA family ATPase [Planctomycetota bacterium]
MSVTAVINQKGGVGKTTTVMNLGAALAERGKKTLLVDLDPQGNLTSHAGADADAAGRTVYDVLLGEATLLDVLLPAAEKNLWVIPSNIDLAAAEIELVGREKREIILRDALEVLKGEGDLGRAPRFEQILVDCPPSLGLLSVNALAAADAVMVPMQAEFFALQGMARLLETVDLVRKSVNPRLRFDGVVPCKVDRRPKLTQEVLDEIRKHFPDQLYDVSIRPNVKLAEAPSFGRSVLSYDPASHGAEDYRALAREFLGEKR